MTEIVRPFTLADAPATRAVFVAAVHQGAAGRYSRAERHDWVPDPAMPADWGPWLAGHATFVAADGDTLTGFMTIEATGYLNMAFVRPDRMGKGTAGRLYEAILREARRRGMTRLTVLASRYAQGFLARRGWRPAPDLAGLPGLDPRQGPADTPVNRPMALTLGPRP